MKLKALAASMAIAASTVAPIAVTSAEAALSHSALVAIVSKASKKKGVSAALALAQAIHANPEARGTILAAAAESGMSPSVISTAVAAVAVRANRPGQGQVAMQDVVLGEQALAGGADVPEEIVQAVQAAVVAAEAEQAAAQESSGTTSAGAEEGDAETEETNYSTNSENPDEPVDEAAASGGSA